MAMERRYKLLLFFLAGTAIFNVLDYFFTLKAMTMGYEEANPIINAILDTLFFPIYKLLIVPCLLTVIWFLREKVKKRVVFYAGIVFVSYFLLMVHFGRIFMLG